MRWLLIGILAGLFMVLLPCRVEAGIEDIRFNLTSWATEHGLPQNSVNKVIQGKQGYIWIATNGGVARFNGKTFTPFNSENTPCIQHDQVVDLMQARDGRIWLATLGGGVSIMDENGKNGLRFTTGDGLANNAISRLYQDSTGVVWIATMRGMNYFENGKIHSLKPPGLVSGKGTVNQYRYFLEDSRNDLWFSVHETPFIHRYNGGKNGDVSVFSLEKILKKDEPVHFIYQDSKHNIWVSSNNHLLLFDGDRFVPVHSQGERLDIVCMAEDRAGKIWGGSSISGLYRVEPDRITRCCSESMKGMNFLSLHVDREGTMWGGTKSSGLIHLNKSIVQTYSVEHGLPHYLMLSLFQDSGGTIWACTNGKGVGFIQEGKFEPFLPVRDAYPWSILKDSRGTLWIGTYGSGLFRVVGDKVTQFTEKDGLPYKAVIALFEDSKKQLWIGTAGRGPCILKDGRFEGFNEHQGFTGKYVIRFFEDRRGALWIGTTANGVNRYQNGTFTNFSTTPLPGSGNTALSHNTVRSIYESPDGALWFGTYGGGINRYKNGIFKAVKKKDGLYDNIVSDILDDGKGYLWMTCNRGVYRVRLSDLNDFADGVVDKVECSFYNKSDGMVSAECNGGFQPSAIKAADGKFWIPTIRGIAVFNPARAKINNVIPNVVIETMNADGNPVDFRVSRELSAGTRNLEFHYTALSFVNPGRVRFKCKLEGFEDKWNDVGFRRVAYYTQLAPGNYTFRVKGCNNDGIWNDSGAAYSFYLRPFFYQTTWFYFLCAIAALGLGVMVFQFRVRRLKNRKIQLQELVAQQTRELREANKTAREEREAAYSANRSKSDFLARMSHEIRTPLNSVIGFSELLTQTEMDDIQSEYVYTISQSGTALLSIINDILDFSKIESGIMAFDPVDFDPEVTAYHVCESILPRIGDRPVEVLCRIGDSVPPYIVQDPGRFRQVLINLMGNAVKFTEKGEIELAIEVEDVQENKMTAEEIEERKNQVKLHCRVRDTGIGISPQSINTIFQVFQQADGSITRTFGGTGLGLPICKQIAKHMGGDITVESTPGYGSTFHFTAWAGVSNKTNLPKNTAADLAGKRALVVDDNPHSLDIMIHMLKKNNLLVTGETSYKNVVHLLTIGKEKNEPYDICIIDTLMPGVSCIELAKEIRSLPGSLSGTPLMALTSIGGKQSTGLRDAGFDGLLPKPVKHTKLLNMINGLINPKDKQLEESKKTDKKIKEIVTQYSFIEEAKHSVRILLVEDNPVNRKLANFLLTQAGYIVDFAETGEEGIKKYSSNPGAYDLILMDIQMPGIDGREATRRIREKEFSKVPIIAMTAETMDGDREKCLEAGMNDYISKPIRREVVFSIIKKWVL